MEFRGQPRQRSKVLHGGGLLDQIDTSRLQLGHAARSGRLVPGLVDVNPHAGLVAHRRLDRSNVTHVIHQGARADLEFEVAVATGRNQRPGLVDIPVGITTGQGPEHRQVLSHSATKQLCQGAIQALAHEIQQRGFDGGLGEIVATHTTTKVYPQGIDVGRRLAEQLWCEVGVDGKFDALRALRTVGQTADGGRLAEPFKTVRIPDAHDDHALYAHGSHRKLVRPDGRYIHQDGFDGLDGGGHLALRNR